MKRKKSLSVLLPVSILTAALGFSFALATSSPEAEPRAAEPPRASGRVIGEFLKFTNPFLQPFTSNAMPNLLETDAVFFPAGGDVEDPDDTDEEFPVKGYDLGDACAGGQITRYISATGGFLPYRFLTKPVLDPRITFGSAVLFDPPRLLPFGRLQVGTLPQGAGPIRFDVTLSDMISTQVTGRFRLNLVQCTPDEFRFAMSRLPTAQQGRMYWTNIQTIGGTPPIRFSVTDVDGTAGKRLEDVGLSFNPDDGTLFGRVMSAVDVKLTVVATDAAGRVAKQRFQPDPNVALASSQSLVIPVIVAPSVSTEVAGLSAQVKGNVPVPGVATFKDSFVYSALLDPKGETLASLAGTPFVMRVGRRTYFDSALSRFDENGKIQLALDASGNPISAAGKGKKAPGRLDVSFSHASGRLAVKLSGVNLSDAVGVSDGKFTDRTFQPLILGFEVGNLRTTEVLMLETQKTATRFAMNYALARRGFSRAGAFQIIDVEGIDARAGASQTGTRWLVRAFGVPPQDTAANPAAKEKFAKPKASELVSKATSVDVSIGEEFTQKVTVALKSVRLQFKGTSADAGLFSVYIDPRKFVHRVDTNVISEADTAIPMAIDTKDPTVFRFGMNFNGLKGESGRVIAPNVARWENR
ncbi:MAG TPA: hypothetical protein VEK08_13050 [Planctomycetota bacterium]|nr:hypothetical protein [Planctomycetota bacterium]